MLSLKGVARVLGLPAAAAQEAVNAFRASSTAAAAQPSSAPPLQAAQPRIAGAAMQSAASAGQAGTGARGGTAAAEGGQAAGAEAEAEGGAKARPAWQSYRVPPPLLPSPISLAPRPAPTPATRVSARPVNRAAATPARKPDRTPAPKPATTPAFQGNAVSTEAASGPRPKANAASASPALPPAAELLKDKWTAQLTQLLALAASTQLLGVWTVLVRQRGSADSHGRSLYYPLYTHPEHGMKKSLRGVAAVLGLPDDVFPAIKAAGAGSTPVPAAPAQQAATGGGKAGRKRSSGAMLAGSATPAAAQPSSQGVKRGRGQEGVQPGTVGTGAGKAQGGLLQSALITALAARIFCS